MTQGRKYEDDATYQEKLRLEARRYRLFIECTTQGRRPLNTAEALAVVDLMHPVEREGKER